MGSTAVKELLVSFDIVSRSAGLGDLASALGATPGPGSRERGAPGPRGPREATVFRLESGAPRTATLEEHLETLFADLARLDVRLGALPAGTELVLSLGVLFDGPMGSLVLPHRFAGKIEDYGLTVEVTWYLSEFTAEDEG